MNFEEPFTSLVHQGTILGPDGFKMSKSRGNVVSPDDIICKVGSDAFRLYLMFGFSYIEGGPWNENGIESITKFMDRVERIVKSAYSNKAVDKEVTKQDKELLFVLNSTIQKVTADTEIFSFNTAIARIMELVNALYKYEQVEDKNYKVFQDACYKLILLLAPFTPCFAEELHEQIGEKGSVLNKNYPTAETKYLVKDEYELAVQINSKNRDKIVVPADSDNKTIIEIAKNSDIIKKQLEGKTIVKEIVIPKRLVNFVVK